MREIEIKARVSNIDQIKQKLSEKGIKFGSILKQHDVVYSLPDAGDDALNANWLRIRTEDDKIVTFTLKRAVSGQLDSIEHETIVENAKELEAIIELLGYKLYSDLTKIRQKAKHGDIEICLDSVPELGDFIEAEKLMEHDADQKIVVSELWKLFEDLGIKKADEEHMGYDVLLRRKRGL